MKTCRVLLAILLGGVVGRAALSEEAQPPGQPQRLTLVSGYVEGGIPVDPSASLWERAASVD